MITGRYKKIWFKKPDDIEAVKRRQGAKNQNLTTLIYAEGDTRALVRFLSYLRELCLSEELDLDTVKKISMIFIESEQSRVLRYYNMKDLGQFLKETLEDLKHIASLQEYTDLIEEVLIYIGRMSFWIDEQIPWSYLASVYKVETS